MAGSLQKGLKAATVLSAALPFVKAAPELDPSCDCYVTDNGITFTEHMVWDFGALAGESGVGVPPILDNMDENQNAGETSDYFSSSEWTDYWNIQTWPLTDGVSVARSNSKNNVYLQTNPDDETSTYLTLRTYRTSSGSFQSSGEVESAMADYTAASIRSKARTHGDTGACSGLFTYKLVGDEAFESDIEVLTYLDDTTVHYTRHPERERSGYTTHYAPTPIPNNGSRSDWHEYRMDWVEDGTQWFVDGLEQTYMEHEDAQVPSSILFNMWSQGNDEWEKTMQPGGQADFDLYWLSIAYNNTASAGQSSCTKTCNI